MQYFVIKNTSGEIISTCPNPAGTTISHVDGTPALAYDSQEQAEAQCEGLTAFLASRDAVVASAAASAAADAKYNNLPLAVQDAFDTKYTVIKRARAAGKFQEALSYFDSLLFPAELQAQAAAIRVDLANF
jgi:hypothetical protein